MSVYKKIGLIVLSFLFIGQSPATEINGKIVSKRIKQFDNFVIYIKKVDKKHFEYKRESTVSIQKEMKIIPHVLPLLRYSKVIFKNNDPDLHNLHTAMGGAAYFNFGIPPGEDVETSALRRTGEIQLMCDIHPEISGYILVLQNPFYSTVDDEGNFKIEGVPKGEYVLKTWHEDFITLSQKIKIDESGQALKTQFIY